MAIRKGEFSVEADYLVLPRQWARFQGLSWEATGMLAYLASHAGNFRLDEAQLVNAHSAGRSVVRRIINELKAAGLLTRVQGHDDAGRFNEEVLWELTDPATLIDSDVLNTRVVKSKNDALVGCSTENRSDGAEPVDNDRSTENRSAENWTTDLRSLKENQVKETKSSSFNELSTERDSDAAPRRDDDSSINDELTRLAPSLTVAGIKTYLLSTNGAVVDPETINYVAAARETLPVASSAVANPAKYVAACIARAPSRWTLAAAPSAKQAQDASWCAVNGGCNWRDYGDNEHQYVYCTRHDAQAQDPQLRETVAA